MTERFTVVPASYVYLLREGPDGGTEVLLQLRHGTGYRDGHWAAAAAGHVEAGETAFDAAHREAAEELGITAVELVFELTMHRTDPDSVDPIDERVDFFFCCRRWEGEPRRMERTKTADMRWFPLAALPEPVVPHERVVLVALRAGAVPPIVTFGFDPGQ